jgi:DNA mismatch endonuclease, patch repair protein
MRARRKIVLVHGCFWHLHDNCALARMPASRPEYWPIKLMKNKNRDQRQLNELLRLGWSVEVVWECETRDHAEVERRLRAFLAS